MESVCCRLERSSPEAEGVSSAAILALLDELEHKEIEFHSLMILRHGKVVAEGWWGPYRPETPHLLYSLSKSFTSTAIGMAIEEGLLSLDDRVIMFFEDKAPAEVSDNLAKMTLRHLLTMSTGQSEAERPTFDWTPKADWARDFLAYPVAVAPGSKFDYSTYATFMCSAILRRVAGEDLLDYLMPRLFDPLGIERPYWQRNPEGISFGGSGLHLTTESIAKFGQLYLQKGAWNGERLLSESWVEMATSKQISNGASPTSDWEQGYGFQFWLSQHGYRGDGAFGQYCLVDTRHDLVIAVTASVTDMQAALTAIWNTLFLGLSPTPLPGSDVGLSKRMASLELKHPHRGAEPLPGLAKAVYEADASSARGGTWQIADTPDGIELRHLEGETEAVYRASYEHWLSSDAGSVHPSLGPTACMAAWTNPTSLELELHELTTPFKMFLTFDFDGEELKVSNRFAGTFYPPDDRLFHGRKQDASI